MFAPITGAWIETLPALTFGFGISSHPSRVRGLKLTFGALMGAITVRTHHGCVD